MKTITKIISLTFSFLILLTSCSQKKINDPIVKDFVINLNKYNNAKEFISVYYNKKDKDVKKIYEPIISEILNSKNDIEISKISDLKNNKYKSVNEKEEKDLYLIQVNGKEIIVKAENNKIEYLVCLRKGNVIIGWV